jgi:hypothetical protein
LPVKLHLDPQSGSSFLNEAQEFLGNREPERKRKIVLAKNIQGDRIMKLVVLAISALFVSGPLYRSP